MLRLILQRADGGTISKRALHPGARFDIGRSDDNDIVLRWDGVSRQHARLEVRPDGIWLEDKGSKNGLLVGQHPEDRLKLEPGLRVQIGSGFLSLEEVGTSDVAIIPLGKEGPSTRSTSRAERGERVADSSTEETKVGSPLGPTAERALEWLARHGTLFFADEDSQGGADRKVWLSAIDLLGANGLMSTCGRATRGADGALILEDYAIERSVGHVPTGISIRLGERADPSCLAVPLADSLDRWLVASWKQGACVEPWQRSFLRALAHGRASEATPAIAPSHPTDTEDSALRLDFPPELVAGTSEVMAEVYSSVSQWVGTDAPVLLRGPTGVGKELIARLIHRNGPHASGELVAFQPSAISPGLIEAELFGIEDKVASDVEGREGLVVRAHGGTLFLDEIGDLSPSVQVKLLRVLQERKVWPVGARRPIDVDFQLVTATLVDLEQAIADGAFREDLFYRLADFEIHIPPLSERRSDIPELVSVFLRELGKDERIPGISRRALEFLCRHAWPGNIRQLRSAVRRAVRAARPGEALEMRHFRHLDARKDGSSKAASPEVSESVAAESGASQPLAGPPEQTLREALDTREREVLTAALEYFGGNQTRVAEALAISRHGLRKKLRRLGLRPDRFQSPAPESR